MKKGFDGMIPTIQRRGNSVTYEPGKFDINSLTEIFKQDNKCREYVMPVSAYTMAVLKNDKEQIAYHEKMFRVDKFRKLKRLIEKWGIDKAKVIEWLNKKDSRSSFFTPNRWTLNDYSKWEYKGVGKGETDSISLDINLDNDKFTVVLRVNDSYGYSSDIYKKVMAENISFTSIINVVNYITKRLENNAY